MGYQDYLVGFARHPIRQQRLLRILHEQSFIKTVYPVPHLP